MPPTDSSHQNPVKCSEEQKTYMSFMEKVDTKLLATAGSGKTFCIIHRIRHLIDNNVYSPHHIFMLTFSKNAKEDFITKLKKNKVDEIPVKNINTIDSFAYAILGETVSKSIDVSILSYSLLRLLNEIIDFVKSNETIGTPIMNSFQIDYGDVMSKLKRVKCIFVDESQDLNETQYKILICLKTICHSELNLIGDPNQNIYQFRNSSDKYLVEYEAKTFNLTKNYRSQGHIVDFCSNLRPYNTVNINFENEKSHPNLDVTFYSYRNTQAFENYILSILHFFKAKHIPLHKVAILAPTRGYLKNTKGVSQYKGLCYIANLLYKHEILFQQFYNDMGKNRNTGLTNENNEAPSQFDGSKITYRLKKDHINLLTYTASKGLEWDYVIIIDANAHLISKKDYDVEKYNAEKYLLYVACSRPRKNLIIFTKHKMTNPWFKDVPVDKYKLSRICEAELEFYDSTKLFGTNETIQVNNGRDGNDGNDGRDANENQNKEHEGNGQSNVITTQPNLILSELVSQLDETIIFDINRLLLPYLEKKEVSILSESVRKWKVPENRQGFSSKFLEHLFYVYAFQSDLQETYLLRDTNNVIKSNNILYCSNEFIISWYFSNRDSMTWEQYDSLSPQLNKRIVEYIDSRFDRSQEFSSYTLVDKFYNAFISSNYEKIKEYYNHYLTDPYNLHNILFISLVSYAITSTHYFYILQYDLFKADIVEKNEDFLRNLTINVKNKMNEKITNFHQKIMVTDNIIAYTDFRLFVQEDDDHMLCVLKPMGEDKLKDIIQQIIIASSCNHNDHNDHNDYNDHKEVINIVNIKFVSILLSLGKMKIWNLELPRHAVDIVRTKVL